MEYTIKQLADLADISPRTLRYYDQIDLLSPSRTSDAGYRYYGPAQVERLQQILFYRELGFSLENIAQILDAPDFDRCAALHDHLESLKQQRSRLDTLILTVEKTILHETGEIDMTDKEKFEGFKQKLIQENDVKYGDELRTKYGKDVLEHSNNKIRSMSGEDYKAWTALETEILSALEQAVLDHAKPNSEIGKEITELHRKWLSYSWSSYSSAAHKSLAQMYVCDERFTAYYDRNVPGCAAFLRDAILIHA